MDVYREERQIVLALVVFSAFILGIISTVILPRQIIDTVIALNQYKYEKASESSSVYAVWQLKDKKREVRHTHTAVLGVKTHTQGRRGDNQTKPINLDPWTQECECLKQ